MTEVVAGDTTAVVLDTNVFVAAGFRSGGASAQILEAVTERRLRMVWNEPTRAETELIVSRIPPLGGWDLSDYFRAGRRFDGEADPELFPFVPDPADRKFLALARSAGAVLVTADFHLLGARRRTEITILRPMEFRRDFLAGP